MVSVLTAPTRIPCRSEFIHEIFQVGQRQHSRRYSQVNQLLRDVNAGVSLLANIFNADSRLKPLLQGVHVGVNLFTKLFQVGQRQHSWRYSQANQLLRAMHVGMSLAMNISTLIRG